MADRYEILTARKQGDKTYWTRIGVAFPMRDRDGFRLVFEALPVPSIRDGAIECTAVLMPPKPRDDGQRSQGAASHAGMSDEIPFLPER